MDGSPRIFAADRMAAFIISVMLLMTGGGCMHTFGRPHSTLRPRAAVSGPADVSVVRLQDANADAETVPVAQMPIKVAGGHAYTGTAVPTMTRPQIQRHAELQSGQQRVPILSAAQTAKRPELSTPEISHQRTMPQPPAGAVAHLLPPQFHLPRPQMTSGHSTTQATAPPSTPLPSSAPIVSSNQRLPRTSNAGNVPATAQQSSSTSRPALPLTAEGLRKIMNQASANDMSEGRVLADVQPGWQVLNSTQGGSSTSMRHQAARTDLRDPASREAADTVSPESDDPALTARPAANAAPATGPRPAGSGEPSMLERLRGLYNSPPNPPAERTRWRLPSPWSVFREKESPAPPPAPASPANAGPDAGTASQDQTPPVTADANLLNDLIRDLEARTAEWPRTAAGEFQDRDLLAKTQQDLRLLYLIADRPADALTAASALSPREQEFWQELMLAIAQYRAPGDDQSRREQLTGVVNQLRSAIRRITPETELRIRRMELCSEIMSYGRIEPFSIATFDPGQPVLLYVELENFSVSTSGDGNYETHFDARIQFRKDGQEEPIETQKVADIRDRASSERNDYYQSFELNVPSHLDAGNYTIQLRLWDRISGRTAEASVAFTVQ